MPLEPPLTSSLLSRSTTGGSSARGVAAAAAISRPAADAAPSSSSPPARPAPTSRSRPGTASPFASGLAGRLFGCHRAAARSASSAAAVFERPFASAATRNTYDEILMGLKKPGGGDEFGKYYNLPALSDPRFEMERATEGKGQGLGGGSSGQAFKSYGVKRARLKL